MRPATLFAAALVALTGVLIAGCDGTPPATSLATPTFGTLELPNPSAANGWASYQPISPPPPVLPTRGRGVRFYFFAPAGSTFNVSLRGLDGTLTPLTENHGTPAPPEEGYFQIISENPSPNPAIYLMYVRAPLTNFTNFDILVVNHSLRTDTTDSAPMVVSLRQRKVFTITVRVEGSGHVTSDFPGIQCGTGNYGEVLTDCSHEFGPGLVKLNPHSNDLNTTKFIGWSGNCAPNVQVCELTLDGTAAMSATAHFGARTTQVLQSPCPEAPRLPGLRWIGRPDCSSSTLNLRTGVTVQCDAKGWFCCEPGPQNSPANRCGAAGQIESLADCQHLGHNAILRQPGGCYEVDSP